MRSFDATRSCAIVSSKPVGTIGALLARLDDFEVGANVRVTLQRGQATREVKIALQPDEQLPPDARYRKSSRDSQVP
ncbi:hypothetical protein A0U87_23445 [Sphingobium sp. MP9-4]|nr:hypothetical protein BV87_15340 [Sphingobium yanoikuyae]TKV40688.1 hypothetical protein A0U87_23445 [Sphingobium sp. MP9-4]